MNIISILLINDPKHQSPQQHILQKNIEPHSRLDQEDNKKFFKIPQIQIIFDNKINNRLMIFKVLINLRCLFS